MDASCFVSFARKGSHVASIRVIQNGRDAVGLSAHAFLRRIVEWPLEAADVEIHDVAHLFILTAWMVVQEQLDRLNIGTRRLTRKY